MAKLTVNDISVQGKRVFVRVDYNVPMEEKDGQMVINDSTRIKETLPTLNLLIQKGARIILSAHLGRPKGQRESSMSLKPVATKLGEMLGRPIAFVDDCIGDKVEAAANALKSGDLLLLENVRYHNEEETRATTHRRTGLATPVRNGLPASSSPNRDFATRYRNNPTARAGSTIARSTRWSTAT